MNEHQLILILHDIRSTHNVGSLLRTADGLGVKKVYFTGYTPYPIEKNDKRLPHIAVKLNSQIHKTALGAEKSIDWERHENLKKIIANLKKNNFLIASIEQSNFSQKLHEFKNDQNIALILGNEVEGLDKNTLELADVCLEIPMLGKKESFNVAIAGGIALYHMRYKA
jgi:23S rRNA (guanosine2251-2'-O)-methyltransferase